MIKEKNLREKLAMLEKSVAQKAILKKKQCLGHIYKLILAMLLPSKKELPPKLHEELKKYVYDIIGYAMDVCKQLPCGLPEYLYQEAFSKTLIKNGIDPHKEFKFHPIFDGKPLDSYIKMDFMVERERGNIIVEAKAIEKLSNKERSQLFGYMVGTSFPIGLLVNFATYPKPTIERYYFDKNDMTLTAF